MILGLFFVIVRTNDSSELPSEDKCVSLQPALVSRVTRLRTEAPCPVAFSAMKDVYPRISETFLESPGM